MDPGGNEPILADDGGVGKLDARVHIFRRVGGFPVVVFFCDNRNMASNKDAGFLSRQRDQAGGGQHFCFSAGDQGVQGSGETELSPGPVPETQMSQMIGESILTF